MSIGLGVEVRVEVRVRVNKCKCVYILTLCMFWFELDCGLPEGSLQTHCVAYVYLRALCAPTCFCVCACACARHANGKNVNRPESSAGTRDAEDGGSHG